MEGGAVPISEAGAAAERGLRRIRRTQLADWAQRSGLIVAWLGVIAFFAAKLPNTFFTLDNMGTILGSQAVLVVLTLALLLPLTAGDYDLSGAATLMIAANVVALLNVNHGVPIWAAILAGIGTGVLVGATNGFFAIVFGLDPFIVTLGMATFLQGIVFWISASNNIVGIDSLLAEWTIVKHVLSIPIEFYYGLALCIVMWYVFEYTSVGRRLLFVGRGRTVSRLSGINVARIRWGALAAAGGIYGLAGVMYAGTLGGSDPSSGTTFLLPAFAAAFLGATCIQPGRFNAWGSIIAVYFLVTGINGLQLMGVESFVQQLFYGGALVLAVAISQINRRDAESVAGRIPTWALYALLALILAAFIVLLVILGLRV